MSNTARQYYFGHPRDGKAVHAYTKDEWGIGASSGGGRQYAIRSFYFSIVVTAMFLPVTLACAVFAVVELFEFPAMTLVFLLFGLIFGLGVVQGYFNLSAEWRGRKLRKLKGLPKPWFVASDDRAYEWFIAHPSPQVPLTPEFFPESVQLRAETASPGSPDAGL